MTDKDLRNWIGNSKNTEMKEVPKSGMKRSKGGPKLTIANLEAFLWKSADILRGSIDSAEYKHYIFGLLFLKRLSDQFEEERKQVKGDPEDPDNYQFFVPERARWRNIRKISEGIGNAIDKAFEALEEQNQSLERVLTPIQFEDPRRLSDTTLNKLIVHFSQKGYNLSNSNLSEPDMLGRAYEYLIKQFADDAGKKGGEFYTPQGVVKTLVRILTPQEGMRICDPACGSGGMLIESINYLKDQGKNPNNISIFGEEKNVNTWAIAKMNLLLHNILDCPIKHGDTMTDPILDEDHLMLFDMVITNPMWNQKEWSREMFEKGDPYGRVKYGIPPKSSGDWIWVQHMLATLNSSGRMGIVLDNGALFRGAREGAIRQGIIGDDLIEGVIALPANLFYNTGSPGCLIIINKQKPKEFKDKIFFIHAENEYEEGKAQNFLREEHITKISEIYHKKEIIEKFTDLIDLEEIKENNFNLNVSRYVDILPEEEPVDISACLIEIRKLQKERNELENIFSDNMKELDYE